MEGRSMPTGVAVLKWFFIIWGIISILLAFVLPSLFMAVFGAMQGMGEELGEVGTEAGAMGAMLGGFMFVWSFFIICWGIFEILIGVFLGKGMPWARIAAIVIGILSLPSFPVGTALGIIALVVLFGQEGKAYFQR
jgi:hypothetical protein